MKYRIAIFCPDSHFLYNIHTLDQKGVGGGVTARVRIAHALAAQGHAISLHINCPVEETLDGVSYHHWTKLKKIESDIFIVSTSGSGMDLTCLSQVEIDAKLKVLFVHGTSQPQGLEHYAFDYIYVPSNFLRQIIIDQWRIKGATVFVTHHGVEKSFFENQKDRIPQRDPFALLYAGHPSKGLDAAISVLRILRRKEARFSLHIFGGNRLWGEEQPSMPDEPGLTFHGLVGQPDLAQKMRSCGFNLSLQAREEPFGMVVTESMCAGCIVLASPVGAYPEIISDGYDGFLVPGIYSDHKTLTAAAGMIMDLVKSSNTMEIIRRNARAAPLGWNTVAKTWEGHWDYLFQNNLYRQSLQTCSECAGEWISLADGLHCPVCGRYQRPTYRMIR